MNMKATVLALMALVTMSSAEDDSNQRRWWVTLEVGSPITTNFQIKIFSSGHFEVMRQEPGKTKFKTVAKGTLSKQEVTGIVEAAKTQIEQFTYPSKEGEERFDGTNVKLTLSSEYADASVGSRAIRSYHEGGKAVKLIVETINSKVAETSKVW